MARIDIKSSNTGGGGGGGNLQLLAGASMSATLTAVADTSNTTSPLKLSTTAVQVVSPLRITTSDASGFYLDAEDSATNNRFSIKRDPSSQLVTLDFASNPAGSTTAVGAIRTYVDGVNLSEAMTFREDGNVGIGTTSPTSKLVVAKTSGSLDAVFTTTDATSSTTIYEDNDLGKGIRITSYGSTASGTLLDGTINRAGSVVLRSNDTSYPMVFGGISTSSEQYYFGRTGFTLALNTTTNNVTIGASSGTARLQVVGSGSTSATSSLLVQNSGGSVALEVLDDSRVKLGNSADFTVYSGSGITSRFSMNVGSTSLATSSAILQVTSTTQGFLPPRMTDAQRAAISSPAEGLLVYNTDNHAVAYRDGTNWGYLCGALQNQTGSGGTLAISFASGNIVNLTLNASTTLTFAGHVVGTYIIQVTQGGAGSNTLTYPASVKWSGGTAPTLTTTVGKTDILTFYHDGTSFFGTYSLNY